MENERLINVTVPEGSADCVNREYVGFYISKIRGELDSDIDKVNLGLDGVEKYFASVRKNFITLGLKSVRIVKMCEYMKEDIESTQSDFVTSQTTRGD